MHNSGDAAAYAMRSFLFVPGDSLKKLEKGLGSDADVLLIDLEDSVAAVDAWGQSGPSTSTREGPKTA